jgi:hypothetical protein
MNETQLLESLKAANRRLINDEITLDYFMGFYEGFRVVYRLWKKSIRGRG